jgi:cell division protein FtsQ
MATKRKISITKVLRAFVTLVVTTGCLVAVLGASRMQHAKKLNKIELQIGNDQYRFLDKQALWDSIITERGIEAGKTMVTKLNVKGIEKTAYKNQWVEDAQVYVDNKRNMHIFVTQRVPVARIFYDNGQSFYLDRSLKLLPLSEFFTYYTTVVTNVPVLTNDSINKSLRAQIVKLVKFVEQDTFWSSQVAQISVTPDLQFELTPVLGTQKIVFGDTTHMKEKFTNLFAFYKKVLNRVGWNRYDVLDLRFKDQIVASPSIPWKPPTKNAISNMDWLKSIMNEAPKEDKVTAQVITAAPAAKPAEPAKPVEAAKPVEKKPEPKAAVKKPELKAIVKRPEAKAIEKKQEQKNTEKKQEQKAIAAPKEKEVKKTNTEKPIKTGKYIYQGNGNN